MLFEIRAMWHSCRCWIFSCPAGLDGLSYARNECRKAHDTEEKWNGEGPFGAGGSGLAALCDVTYEGLRTASADSSTR